jgi:hypothetical protein
MDLAALFRLLKPLLVGVLGQVSTANPIAAVLVQLALTLLNNYSLQHLGGGRFAAVGPKDMPELPPEHQWTPDGLVQWAREHPAHGAELDPNHARG